MISGMRERPTLDWIPLVLLAALTIGLRAHQPPAPTSWAEPGHTCVEYDHTRENMLRRADWEYRHGNPAAAAEALELVTPVDDLATLHEQYRLLAVARAIALDPASNAIQAFEALRAARTLDVALGGALADEQTGWMRRIAPKAARMYGELQDHEGAELARHTGDLAF